MNLVLKAALLSAPLLQGPVPEQVGPQLNILVLNGTTGKPIPDVRLLVFAGSTPEETRLHTHSFDLKTDREGAALVPSGQMWPSTLQVLADHMTTCEPHPKSETLSILLAMRNGLVTPNSCGTSNVQAKPRQLIVFARKPTLQE